MGFLHFRSTRNEWNLCINFETRNNHFFKGFLLFLRNCYNEVNNMDENIIVRSVSETSDILKIKQSTLRKYCIALENAGYKFTKSERGHRSFMPDDITILQRLVTAKNQHGITLSQSANTIVKLFQQGSVTDSDTEKESDITPHQHHNTVMTYEQMATFMENQQKFNKELLDRLDRQQEYIDESLNKRDEQLMSTLREVQETKKLLAASKEKKSKWKFWRR